MRQLDVLLHRAATQCNVFELSRLLHAEHDINARCQKEDSPLSWAVLAVQLLLSRGSDPTLRGRSR